MSTDLIIRSAFLREYAARKNRMLQQGWDMINDRDKLLRQLNRKYGYAEPDGSFGIGKKTHIDTKYKAEYDRIESDFEKPYKRRLPEFDSWARSQEITVGEFLLLDNIWDEDLNKIVDQFSHSDDWQLNTVKLKGSLLISRWKSEHPIGEIQRRAKIEISHFGYAASRCRRSLNIGFLDITKRRAILTYSRAWKNSLEGALARSFVQ